MYITSAYKHSSLNSFLQAEVRRIIIFKLRLYFLLYSIHPPTLSSLLESSGQVFSESRDVKCVILAK